MKAKSNRGLYYIRCDENGTRDKDGTCVREGEGGRIIWNIFSPVGTEPERFRDKGSLVIDLPLT